MDSSPTPQDDLPVLSFYDALPAVLQNKHITRREWPQGEYGFMEATVLMIHRLNGNHTWQISEGDLLGTDWEIL